MYNNYKAIENDIYDSINSIIDEYLEGRTAGTSHAKNVISRNDYDSYFDGKVKTIYDAKKDFKGIKSLKTLINDIKFVGFRQLMQIEGGENEENKEKYTNLVKKILNDILKDRIALEKDKVIMETKRVISFTDMFLESRLNKLNEVVLPVMKIDEILDDVTQVTNDTLKRVLVSFYKTYADYIDLNDKKKHTFKVHDMVGDIMNNNRVSFDVCIFEKGDLERITENLIDFAIGEFHNELPNSLNIFGIDMKPSSFINKDDIKEVFAGIFIPEEVVKIITNILGYKYAGQFNDFYIWDNK